MEFKELNTLKNLEKEKLIEELKQTQKKLVELKFKKSVDRIVNTSEFKKLRKYIARIMTLLHSKKETKVLSGAKKK